MYSSRQELHTHHLTSVTERLEACWERWNFHIERWWCTYSHLILTTTHIPNQHAHYAIRITFSLPSARELKAIDSVFINGYK